ncbi:MAG: hypothetical protein LQ345_001273 [Seirophora villosa]|nr:MAG: hypothetical protein LQ345_001273 [Seirophora villosa]
MSVVNKYTPRKKTTPPNSIDLMTEQDIPSFTATTFTDLAIQAIRRGMTWTVFRPEHGVFLAEGNGYALRPRRQQPLSFEIVRDPRAKPKVPNSLYISSPLVDKLFFGILPGYDRLHLPDYRMGNITDVSTTMYSLDPTGSATKKIQDNRHPSFAPDCLFGFADIIPLAAPMLRQRGSTIIRLPIPAQYTVGLLTHKEGFVVFRHRLADFIASLQPATATDDTSPPAPHMALWVRDKYRELMKRFPEWEDEVLANSQINNRSLEFLNACNAAWDDCTAHLHALTIRYGKHFYRNLMAAHLKNAVNWWHQAWNRMASAQARDHYGLRNYIAEGMHLYWDYLDLVVREMHERGWSGVPEATLREAWVVMVFRGFCWWRCHWMMEGQDMCKPAPERLPSEYYSEDAGEKEEGYVIVAKD